MIISHKHKFIFVKPGKVAGTALEIALAETCGENDILTPISKFDSTCDTDVYSYTPRNNQGCCEHMSLKEIEKIAPSQVNNYDRVSIARNPWDMAVSRWYWEKWLFDNFGKPNCQSYINMLKKIYINRTFSWNQIDRKLKINAARIKISQNIIDDDFTGFISNFPEIWTNNQYYFTGDELAIDTVIQFETLQSDYETLCSKLGVKTNPLSRVKSKLRPANSPYRDLYNSESRERIEEQFNRQITCFNYKF